MEHINYPEAIVGVILGIAATLLQDWLRKRIKERKEKKIYGTLEGLWVEQINGQSDRMFSLGEFQYEETTGSFHYNGKNYRNDLSEHYFWRSEKLFKDPERERLLYIYSVSTDNEVYMQKDGFGVSYYKSENGKLSFTKGYFLDADAIANPHTVQFFRASDKARELNFDLGNRSEERKTAFIARLIERQKADFTTS